MYIVILTSLYKALYVYVNCMYMIWGLITLY